MTNLRASLLCLLYEDHGGGDKGALPDVVGRVILHGLDQPQRLLVAAAGEGDAQGHGRAVPGQWGSGRLFTNTNR